MQGLDVEAGGDVTEEIVDQMSAVDQGTHGFTPWQVVARWHIRVPL
jgi:hypothetical protein